MPELSPEVERQIASMSDNEFSALTARLRAPDSTEQLRSAAAKVLSPAALDSFMAIADVSKFVDDDGAISDDAVIGKLTAAFGGSADGTTRQWGTRGAAGKAAAARRFKSETPAAAPVTGQQASAPPRVVPNARPGDGGRAAAARRFNTQEGTAQS